MESHILSRILRIQWCTASETRIPGFRWRTSVPCTHINIPISPRRQLPGPQAIGDKLRYQFCTGPSKSRVHLLFSSAWAFKPFPFEISLFPRPAGDWRRRYFFWNFVCGRRVCAFKVG